MSIILHVKKLGKNLDSGIYGAQARIKGVPSCKTN